MPIKRQFAEEIVKFTLVNFVIMYTPLYMCRSQNGNQKSIVEMFGEVYFIKH